MGERMFDEHSFIDEVVDKESAKSCIDYLASNERSFRRELNEEGLTYEEEDALVKQIWSNLLNSCKKVGFSNYMVEHKNKQLKIN